LRTTSFSSSFVRAVIDLFSTGVLIQCNDQPEGSKVPKLFKGSRRLFGFSIQFVFQNCQSVAVFFADSRTKISTIDCCTLKKFANFAMLEAV
jgi:hypothetical protein